MANNAGQITFGVGFKVDRTGLKELEQSLNNLKKVTTTDFMQTSGLGKADAQKQIREMLNTVNEVEVAMKRAFNPQLGSLNLSKFKSELSAVGLSTQQLYNQFSQFGAAGEAAFRNVATQTLTANVQLKQHNKLLVDMGKTLANSFKYTVSYGFLNSLTSGLQNALSYTKALDSSLNDIRIVTDKSAEDMERFAESANKAAKELGQSTTDYTKASLIYYQQGLGDEDVAARTETTLKAANVTGQSTAEVSEQLTAVWNGYKVSAAEAETYVDKLAAVAATTASDLEELSTGMSKVASAANAMGVDVDQLNAQLATIVSVTRQAPESAGTALKTIYARMGDLELDGEDEFGVSLGEVSSSLDAVGIKILDTTGNLRDMGDVIEEVGAKWNSGVWSQAEKQALAIDLAGKRQYNNLLALFDNWEMYQNALATSINSQGTLQRQQDIYMESTAAHLQQMQTAWEGVKDAILKPDDINPVVDAFGGVAGIVEEAIESVDGLKGILGIIGTVALQAFGPTLGQGIAGFINNLSIARSNVEQLRLEMTEANTLKNSNAYANGDPTVTMLVDQVQQLEQMYHNLDSTQANTHKNLLENAAKATNKVEELKDAITKSADTLSNLSNQKYSFNSLLNTSANQEDLANMGVELNSNIELLRKWQLQLQENGDNANSKAGDIATLAEEYKNLGGSIVKDIDILNQYANATTTNAQANQEASAAAARIIQAVRQASIELSNGEQAIEEYSNATADMDNKIHATVDNLNALNTQNITANITNAIGSISQFTMGVQSLTNAFTTLGDEELSAGEKATRFLISFTMGLPMVINSLQSLEKIFGITSGSIETLNLLRKTSILLDNSELGFLTIYKAAKNGELELKAEEVVLEKILSDLKKAGFVDDATTLANISAETKAIWLKDAALTGETQSILAAKKAQDLFNSSVLANPYLLAGAAIAAITIGTTTAIIKHYQEARKEAVELNKKQQDLIDGHLEEINSSQELANNYLTLYEEYKKSGKQTEELSHSALELCDKYDLQASKILALTGNYDALTEAIKRKQKADLEEQQEENKRGQNAAKAELTNAMNPKGMLAPDRSLIFNTNLAYDNGDKEALAIAQRVASENGGSQAYQASVVNAKTRYEFSDAIEAYETYEKIIKALEDAELQSSDVYKNLQKEYGELAETYQKYKQYIDQEKDTALKLYEVKNSENLSNFRDGMSFNASEYNNFEQEVNKLKEYLTNSLGLVGDELDNTANAYISSLNNVYAVHYSAIEQFKKYNPDKEILEELKNLSNEEIQFLISVGYSGQGTKEDLKRILDTFPSEGNVKRTITLEYIEGIKEGLSDSKLTKKEKQAYLNNLSEASAENPVTYAGFLEKGKGDQFDIMQQAENEAIANRVEEMQELVNVQEHSKNLAEEQQKILEIQQENQLAINEALATEITFQGQTMTLEKLRNNILGTEEALRQARAKGDEEHAEILEKQLKIMKEAFDVNKPEGFDALEEALQISIDKAQELADALINVENTDFGAIQTEAFDLIDKSIDTTITKIDNLTTAAQLIGEGFKVAADDVDKLAEAYPELFNKATVVAEDMMQLDKTVVKNFVEGKQTEIKAEIETQLKKLGIQRDLLEAEKASNDARIQTLRNFLNGTATAETTRQELAKYTAEYKKKVDDICTEAGITNLQQANQANTQVSGNVLENIRTLYTAYQQLGAAAAAALAGEKVGEMNIGSISSSEIRGWQDKSNGNFDTEDDQLFYQEALAQIQEISIRNEEIDAELQQVAVQEAKLNARMTETLGTLGRVGSGKAGKKSKSSGSSSQPDKKDLLHAEKEIDAYHDINLELDEIEHHMKLLQKAEDKAFGKNYLDNLNAQNKLLEKQKALLKEKLQLTANDMATRRAQLAEMGAMFDDQGYMTNYNALLTEHLNKYNQLVLAYNAMSAAEQKAAKQSLEDAKKEYDLLKERISAYDKLFNSFHSLEEELQDKMDEQIENQIKAFNYEVDVRLDMAEATRDWNSFYEKVIADIEGIDDPVKKIITSMQTGLKNFETYFNGRDGLGSVQYLTEHVRETMAQIEQIKNTGTSSVYGDNMSAAVEDLKKYNDSLMDNLEDVQDIINDIKKSYLDAIDDANDKLKEQTKQYEYIADLIQHDMNLVELIGGEDDYDDLARYYELMHQNNMQNVEFLRMQRDAINDQLATVEEGSEAWKKLYEQVQDAQKDLNSAVEDSLNNIIDKYSNAIKNVFDKLNKAVTGGLGLDYMQDSYDRGVDAGNDYLDDVNRLYAIEKIRNKYRDALNSTSDLAAQRKLADVMAEQLKYLEDKDKLSQYEVDRAEKIYDLTLKQIALQEAQANKTQLRLRRDNQGNYSYQYVADQDAMNDAQQELNDAQNDLYNFDLDRYRDILGQATDLTKEYEELVTEILENVSLSEEERTERLAEVKDWYYTKMNDLEEQLAINTVNLQQSANDALQSLYDQNNQYFQGVLMDEMVPGWDGALQHMVENFTEDFIPRCEDSMNELNNTTKDYQDELDELEHAADVDFNSIQHGIDNTIDATKNLMDTNQQLIASYYQEMQAVTDVLGRLDELINKYDAVRDAAIAMAKAASDAYNQIQLTQYKALEAQHIEGMAGAVGNYSDATGNVGSGGGSGVTPVQQVGAGERSYGYRVVCNGQEVGAQASGLTREEAQRIAYGKVPSGYVIQSQQWVNQKIFTVVAISSGNNIVTNATNKPALDWQYQAPKPALDWQYKRFATGGYTGDWHSTDGKLAVLDQKELVLNADDTENMLSAVNVVRHIVSSLDSAMLSRMAGMQAGQNIGSVVPVGANNSAVDQNVTISATFPSVTSHTEIEQAFENLVNRASQAAWS